MYAGKPKKEPATAVIVRSAYARSLISWALALDKLPALGAQLTATDVAGVRIHSQAVLNLFKDALREWSSPGNDDVRAALADLIDRGVTAPNT